MTIIALIRVSDSTKQSNLGQRDRIKNYLSDNKLIVDRWINLEISASKSTAEERGWYKLIGSLNEGDAIVTSDVARISRDQDPGEIIFALQSALRIGIDLHFVDTRQMLSKGDMSDPAKLFGTVAESFLASRFSKERSMKAKSAAARRKRSGLLNGRKPGYLVKSKLDDHEDQIIRSMSDGVPKSHIANEVGVARGTFINWLAKRDEIRKKAKKLGADSSWALSKMKLLINNRTN